MWKVIRFVAENFVALVAIIVAGYVIEVETSTEKLLRVIAIVLAIILVEITRLVIKED